MAKTQATLHLEQALDEMSRKKREYGCEEVTIGFHSDGHGDEIVDYMTMDSKDVFRCYELKVTLSDLKTDNKKSFYGDYNYLVVSESLYAKNPSWGNYIPPYVGILSGTKLTVRRQAKKKVIDSDTREMLKSSLIRSVYWKYENYKDASSLSRYRDLEKQLQEAQDALTLVRQQDERAVWTAQDYEVWYRKNHQNSSFSIEKAGKEERRQYALREKNAYTWKENNGSYVCPSCGQKALGNQKTDFCPFCGTDLRSLK